MLLFFFSGAPGCGKTALANSIAQQYKIPLFCRDHIQGFLFRRNLITTNTIDGYLWILEQAKMQLSLGVGCVLDAVFPRQEFRDVAIRYAQEHNAIFIPIYCYCSDKNLWKSRWMERATTAHESHYMTFTWDDVERIETQFELWEHPNLIQLDAVKSYEENLQILNEGVKKLIR